MTNNIRRYTLITILLGASLQLFSQASDWKPVLSTSLNGEPLEDLTINGRPYEIYEHGVKPEWGYQEPQEDGFILIHPKKERRNAPLYVVLHSAGHDLLSALNCTREVDNHDLYHSPDDFYALYLDCRRNQGDWWWGGTHHLGDSALSARNSGEEPNPVEKRVMETVRWVIRNYDIDTERVYLSGISMGGSGTLGIGMRNGDVFASVKAGVPAGIEHVSNRINFSCGAVSKNARIPDPPVVVDYSAQNDEWSLGHDLFLKAMNDRKYALILYWGPFGHDHIHARIEKVNDLVNTFDWLNIKKNEPYPVFTNASGNDKIPWPDDLDSRAAGQINSFFRWESIRNSRKKIKMSLYIVNPAELKTTFEIPVASTADVSLRRIRSGKLRPGESFRWFYGSEKGQGKADENGLITIPGLKITAESADLVVDLE